MPARCLKKHRTFVPLKDSAYFIEPRNPGYITAAAESKIKELWVPQEVIKIMFLKPRVEGVHPGETCKRRRRSGPNITSNKLERRGCYIPSVSFPSWQLSRYYMPINWLYVWAHRRVIYANTLCSFRGREFFLLRLLRDCGRQVKRYVEHV